MTNANNHPEKFYVYKILRFLSCLLLIIFQLVKLLHPGMDARSSLGPQAWHFGHLLEETTLSLLFLAIMGKKGSKREG